MSKELLYRLNQVQSRINDAEVRFHRRAGSVGLLPISKHHSPSSMAVLYENGISKFGENTIQEAAKKIDILKDYDIQWHFVGNIQANKTRPIAENFAWVHSIDRYKIAKRLSEQRPDFLPKICICIQVNVSSEPQKFGASISKVPELMEKIRELPNITLRGLMCIPAKSENFSLQREAFAKLRELFVRCNQQGNNLDTLSMGMSGDLEAAIAEGATLVRIGSAIFGTRL